MAGDWIKLEHATITKPEVIAMADLLEKTPEEVFGMLFHVWCWFDKQSRDGNAGSVTGNALMRFIDHLVRRPGFAACMKKVGWLTDSGMPNFERHNGESAKKRALTNDRVKRSRNAKCNADVTQKALPEKRREEKKETKAASAFSLPEWVPESEWLEFVKMRARRWPLTEEGKRLAVRELEKLRDSGHDPAAVLSWSVLNSYRGLFPPKSQPEKKDDFAGMLHG